MKLVVETKVMQQILDKICRIASASPDDGIRHEMKVVTANGKGVFFEAGNAINTMTIRIHLNAEHCDIDGETEFCVPAYPLKNTVSLMKEGTVTFEKNGRLLSVSESAGGDDDEHIIVGSDPSEWQGPPVLNDEKIDVDLNKEFLFALGPMVSFSCSQDKTQAPFTGIHFHIDPGGAVRATSMDRQRMTTIRDENGYLEIREIPEEGFSFLLPPTAAKFIPQIFDDGDGIISMKANEKRAIFSSGGVRLDVTGEIGVAVYPDFSDLTNVPDQFEWDVNAKELNRITNLVAIVASKTLAKINFHKSSDKMTISGVGLSGKGNKSRHTMKPTETTGHLTEDSVIDVACVDFAEAIAVPSNETIKVGLSKTTSPNLDTVLRIRQETPVNWEHLVFPAKQVT